MELHFRGVGLYVPWKTVSVFCCVNYPNQNMQIGGWVKLTSKSISGCLLETGAMSILGFGYLAIASLGCFYGA